MGVTCGRVSAETGRELHHNPSCPQPYRRFWAARRNRVTCSDVCRKALSRIRRQFAAGDRQMTDPNRRSGWTLRAISLSCETIRSPRSDRRARGPENWRFSAHR
jgi:hypothetical protein